MSRIQLLDAKNYQWMPWKNGRGSTSEIVVHPASSYGATSEFVWRLSVATVADRGAFSPFPGCDRILIPLDSAGMTIEHPELLMSTRLTQYEVYEFSGDEATVGDPGSANARDLNVITRRELAGASADVVKVDVEPRDIALQTNTCLVHCVLGRCGITLPDHADFSLLESQTLRMDAENEPPEPLYLTIVPREPSVLVVVGLTY